MRLPKITTFCKKLYSINCLRWLHRLWIQRIEFRQTFRPLSCSAFVAVCSLFLLSIRTPKFSNVILKDRVRFYIYVILLKFLIKKKHFILYAVYRWDCFFGTGRLPIFSNVNIKFHLCNCRRIFNYYENILSSNQLKRARGSSYRQPRHI